MSDDASDLDALVRRVDPDRWLSSRFIPDARARADVVALYAYDHELARAPRVASNALLGEMRLAWWREALDEVFENRPVRRHPAAQALAEAVARRRLERAPLEAMIDARYRELDPAAMSEAETLEWARDTGGRAAEVAAHILDPGGEAAEAAPAGALWSLGWRLAQAPELAALFESRRGDARRAASRLSVAAFPAVAHAALAGRKHASDLGRRIHLTIAVARGRI